MEYNTNHLGYKLFSGQLKGNRKNSEQMNKFVAGYLDTDGSVYYSLDNKGYGKLRTKLTQSDKNDPKGKLMYALRDYYNLGNVYVYDRETGVNYSWELSSKDSKMLFSRVGKHLFIKQNHFQSMIDMFDNKVKENVDICREESRKISCSLGYKKHISPAYLAGVLAGDGYIKVLLNKPTFNKKRNQSYLRNEIRFVVVLHKDDSSLLYKLASDFGGRVHVTNKGYYRWEVNLGKGSKTAHQFTKDVMSYMILDCKYVKLMSIDMFYKQLAETK